VALFRLAWRNLWRHRRRSLITAGAMAIAVALCMAVTAFTDGMGRKMFQVLVEQQLGHVQVHHPDYPSGRRMYDTVPDVAATLQALDGSTRVHDVAPQLDGYALIGGPEHTTGGQLLGVRPSREVAVTRVDEQIVQGRFLRDDGEYEIVLGVGLAQDLEVQIDSEVVVMTQAADGSLGNALFRVVGVFRSGNSALDHAGTMVRLADLQELLVLPDQAHRLTILGQESSGSALADLKQDVQGVVPPGSQVETWDEASPEAARMVAMMDASSGIMLGLVFAVASFGVLNTMAMSVFERTRELGVLKALGLRPGKLVQMVVFESFLLAALAGALGLVLGGALDALVVYVGVDMSTGDGQGMTFQGVTLDPVIRGHVEPGRVLMILGALLLVSTAASLFPAWRAARLDPVDAIRTE